MKKNSLFSMVLAALFLTFFVSCKKDEIDLKRIPADLANTKIYRYYGNMFTDTLTLMGTVNYNKFGDPVSIIKPPQFVGTGNPNYTFWYDKKGRLSDFIGLYSGGIGFEGWRHYYYDKNDRIVRDSAYIFGSMVDGKPNVAASYASTYEYDAFDRVIRTTLVDRFGHSPLVQDFVYDERGNLDGSTTNYDNNFNPHLLNKVWQFIELDYSINNVISGPIQYNNKRLPIDMAIYEYNPYFLGQITGSRVKIEYSK
ncbi:hypothetical protein [Pinibacter soli]|uniref:DUF4595 domain-containing protein n=1 Tax=Pinibacter soli TaxID=3044211 RepID=A0ABT6RGN8_9BACT|nr:hypothetical protein [Pinibacter soli]MDI3321727.1 hypothetical protein [Pinibacter soli]